MATQSQLVMRMGPNPGKTFSLTKAEISIGRDISNDIVINDAEVSRKHARLIAQGDQYVLEDLGSTNGTFINGQRIAGPHLLTSGETIQMGDNVTMSFESTSFDPDATAVMTSKEASAMDTAAEMPAPMFDQEMAEEESEAPAAEPMAFTPEPVQPAEPEIEPMPPAPQLPDQPAVQPMGQMPEPEPAPMAESWASPEPAMPAEKASTFAEPDYPSSEPIMPEEPEKKSNRTPIIIGCGCLAIVACLLGAWLTYNYLGDWILNMLGF